MRMYMIAMTDAGGHFESSAIMMPTIQAEKMKTKSQRHSLSKTIPEREVKNDGFEWLRNISNQIPPPLPVIEALHNISIRLNQPPAVWLLSSAMSVIKTNHLRAIYRNLSHSGLKRRRTDMT